MSELRPASYVGCRCTSPLTTWGAKKTSYHGLLLIHRLPHTGKLQTRYLPRLVAIGAEYAFGALAGAQALISAHAENGEKGEGGGVRGQGAGKSRSSMQRYWMQGQRPSVSLIGKVKSTCCTRRDVLEAKIMRLQQNLYP